MQENIRQILDKGLASCIIYLSAWSVNVEAIARLSSCGIPFFVKLHPHVKMRMGVAQNIIDVDPSMPAEIFINKMCEHCNEVTVFHHGSSVVRYVNNVNSKFILLR